MLVEPGFVISRGLLEKNGQAHSDKDLAAKLPADGKASRLNGFFSLEEHHARDLEDYFQSLAVHPHHNYYEGDETADLTPWVEYFIQTLARVFQAAEKEVRQNATAEPNGYQDFLKKLDRRAKQVVGLFLEQETINSADAATLLKITDRTARTLLLQWVDAGWLIKIGSGNRDRRYQLSEIYRKFTGS